MQSILILDAAQRSALAAVRSLGAHGVAIHVADSVPKTLAGASKFTKSQATCPDPRQDADAFVDWVLRYCHRQAISTVLPLTDVSTMLLARHRNALGPASLLCAPEEAYENASDKRKLVELASHIGVPVPRTTIISSTVEFDALSSQLQFPLIIKPARSRVLLGSQVVDTAVFLARTVEQAKGFLKQQSWLARTVPCLIQEFIPGFGTGVFALFDRGEERAWFAHQRLREKPPSGGVSVWSESRAIDHIQQGYARKLLQALNWTGPAMVEFRVSQDGTPYLMEINGRFWGSLQLAIDAGVDFPWLLLQNSGSAPVSKIENYEVGRRLRWLLGDVDNLLIQLKQGAVSGSRLKVIADFLATFFDPRTKQEIFRWNDPSPAWFELKSWLRSAL